MSYLNTMLKKSNLHALREYLLYGEQTERCLEGYEDRLNKAYLECLDIVKIHDPKGDESPLFKSAIKMATEHETIYMDLGIQAGFLLAIDIIKDPPTDRNNNAFSKDIYVKSYNAISKIISELQEIQRKAEEMCNSNS